MEGEEQVEAEIIGSDGVKYIIKLTPKEIEDISTDPCKYESLLKQLQSEGTTSVLKTTYQAASHSEDIYLDPKPGPSTDCGSTSVQKWNDKNIKLLLDLRLGMEERFVRPICKKNKLWEDISKKMKENGYQISANDCNMKYRNLLQTYKQNKEKRLKATGESKITWEYFDIFDAILGTKSSSAPSSEMLLTETTTEQENMTNEDTSSTCSSTYNLASINNEGKSRKRKKSDTNSMSVEQYLFLKHNRAEEKQKKDDDKWEEEKKLREAEINAINELARAISSQNPSVNKK